MLKKCFPALLALTLFSLPGYAQEKPVDIKPYDSVITAEAKSKDGVFRVHRLKDKLYYEIPTRMLDRDFLLVTQVAQTKAGVGSGGEPIDERVVRWHRRDNKILLLDIDYGLYADPKTPVARAVEAANHPAILFSFPIEAIGKEGAPVVEVSRMYVGDSIELSPKTFLGARIFDPTRCFLEYARAFPDNIEVESTLTLSRPADPVPMPFAQRGMPVGTASVLMHYSMVKLPAQPMLPRVMDTRVGYFTVNQIDYGRALDRVQTRRFICRWRLEKKDPTAEISEPIKPIVFYIDPATPTEWVPYIKKGIEEWQPAFEEAGFKNAIIAKDAPTDDPDWSMEDSRNSVIRWVPSEVRNAYGPHISDPRSGEILNADIHMFHNILDLQRTWYLTQVGPLDPRARILPLPNELMGQLVQFVVAHEVGHSLGLPHNMKASSMYPAEKVRDKNWVAKMGHCPSIMDYSRFNYVAQPEDHIALEDLIPRVGPYDRFSIRWGYKPVAGATTSEAEASTLDTWAREQDRTPWLRFNTPGSFGIDAGTQTEAVGDADAVYATTYGLKNIRRVMDMLPNATNHAGESYEDMGYVYGRALSQWFTELMHVVLVVGGMNTQEKHSGQSGPIFTALPRARQEAAVKFLQANAFHVPDWIFPKHILDKARPNAAEATVGMYQRFILGDLMDSSRLRRMGAEKTYPPDQFLRDLRVGIFQEFYGKDEIHVSPLRRRLQVAMLDNLADAAESSGGSDEAALARMELKTLEADLRKAAPRAKTTVDKAHTSELIEKVHRNLDPRVPRDRARAAASRFQSQTTTDRDCWEENPAPQLSSP